MDLNPYEPPREVSDKEVVTLIDERREMLQLQFSLLRLLVPRAVFDFGWGVALELLGPGYMPVFWLLFLGLGVVMAYIAFRMARLMHGVELAVVNAVLMLVPCLGVLVVLLLNGNAVDWLRKKRVIVGYFGAKPSEWERLLSKPL